MADNNAVPESVVSQIRKLRAMSVERGCSESEAQVASQKMWTLLARHNLSLASIKESDQPAEDRTIGQHHFATKKMGWQPYMWQAVARLNFCEYLRTKGAHIVIGTKANCQVTQEMAEYLVETVKTLSIEGARKKTDLPVNERASYMISFRRGCADRLRNRIDLLREQAKKGTVKPAEGDSKLPALADIYAVSQTRLDDWMKQHYPKLKNVKSKATVRDLNGYQDGRDAAEKVELKPKKKVEKKGAKQIEKAAAAN